MAIAFIFESTEVDQAGYDAMMEGLGRSEVTSELPSGVIGHLSGPSQNGWRVVDIWEDEASAQAFYGSERFQSIISGGPQISSQPWPLHRVEIAKTISRID